MILQYPYNFWTELIYHVDGRVGNFIPIHLAPVAKPLIELRLNHPRLQAGSLSLFLSPLSPLSNFQLSSSSLFVAALTSCIFPRRRNWSLQVRKTLNLHRLIAHHLVKYLEASMTKLNFHNRFSVTHLVPKSVGDNTDQKKSLFTVWWWWATRNQVVRMSWRIAKVGM